MFIFDSILLAPLNGIVWIAKKINELSNEEQSDEGSLKEQLMEAQMRFEFDEISEEEYNTIEKELLERLDAIRQRNEVD